MKPGLLALSFFLALTAQSGLAQSIPTAQVPGGTLKPFWLKPTSNQSPPLIRVSKLTVQVHQVTNGQFRNFVKNHTQWQKEQVSPLYAEESYLDQMNADLSLKEGVSEDSPVTSVSWFAARAYCESIGFRLPTANEWEYLAAASEKRADANQDPKFLQRILDWYSQPKMPSLPKVKSIYKNLYGLHDMHGLVWEWVEDFNSSLVTGEGRDSSLNRDLFCGAGSMSSGDKENYAAFMRFAFRSSLKGSSALWNLSFRCVKGEPK